MPPIAIARSIARSVTCADVAGSAIVNVVPLPGALSTLMRPPDSLTIARTVARPRPVPLPSGLVVKNGSKICACTSGDIPVPVSVTAMLDHEPVASAMARVLIRNSPPRGMASRALIARLRSACSTWPRSAWTGGTAGSSEVINVTCSPSRRLAIEDRSVMSALTSKTESSRGALAAEGEELARQRGGAIDGLQDLAKIVARHLVRQFRLDEARVAGNDGQQVVEIVRDAAGHPADDLHLLRLAQLRFEQPALGHVDERAHQPLGLPVGIAGDAAARIDVAHRAARQRDLDVEVVVAALSQRAVRRGDQRLSIVWLQPLAQLLERGIVAKLEQRRQRSRRRRAVRREIALIEADARRREHELVDRLALLQCGGLRLQATDQHRILVRHAGEAGEHAGEVFIAFAEWRATDRSHDEDAMHARRRRERRDHDGGQGRIRRGKAEACVPAGGLANHAAATSRLTKRGRDLGRSQVLGRFPIAAARQDRRRTLRRFVEDRGDRHRCPRLLADRAAGHVEERHGVAFGDEALSALGEHCEGRGHRPLIMVKLRKSATTAIRREPAPCPA